MIVDAPGPSVTIANSVCACSRRCDDNCINRQLLIECTPSTCTADHCTNRRLQQLGTRQERLVRVVDTGTERGRGVRALMGIARGTLLGEYTGEVVSVARLEHRQVTVYRHFRHHYGVMLGRRMAIDAYLCGNEMRFANHCCEPNCVMEKWLVNGQPRVAVYALKDLAAGEEVTYDYEFASHAASQPCFCQSPDCRRYIRAKQAITSGASMSSPASLSPRQVKLVRTRRIFLLRNRQTTERSVNAVRHRSAAQSTKADVVSPAAKPAKTSPVVARTSHGDSLITNTVDMSYMEEADASTPVNSYDTDTLAAIPAVADGEDQCRCVCGMNDEDGDMVYCEVSQSPCPHSAADVQVLAAH